MSSRDFIKEAACDSFSMEQWLIFFYKRSEEFIVAFSNTICLTDDDDDAIWMR